MLAAILVALVIVTNQRNEARRARAEAERNYQAARQAVLDFFTSVSQSELLRYERLAPLRRELLQRAANYFSAFAAEHTTDVKRRADVAQALNVLGDAQTQLGAFSDGRATMARSIEVRRTLSAEAPSDTRRAIDLAAAVINLANVEYAESNFAAAVAGYKEAVRILEPAHGQGVEEATSRLAQATHNLAVNESARADLAAAEHRFLQAIQLRRTLVKSQPASARYAAELAASLTGPGKAQGARRSRRGQGTGS